MVVVFLCSVFCVRWPSQMISRREVFLLGPWVERREVEFFFLGIRVIAVVSFG